MTEQQNKGIEGWREMVCENCGFSGEIEPSGICWSSVCKGEYRNTPFPLTMEDWEKEFIEKGAELEHIRWAKWQNYLHTFLVWNNDIQMWTLPHEKKEWWDSEICTPYSMLTEKQKESDRKEVRQYIPLIRLLLSSAVSQALKEQIEDILAMQEIHMGDGGWVYQGDIKKYAISKGLLSNNK